MQATNGELEDAMLETTNYHAQTDKQNEVNYERQSLG